MVKRRAIVHLVLNDDSNSRQNSTMFVEPMTKCIRERLKNFEPSIVGFLSQSSSAFEVIQKISSMLSGYERCFLSCAIVDLNPRWTMAILSPAKSFSINPLSCIILRSLTPPLNGPAMKTHFDLKTDKAIIYFAAQCLNLKEHAFWSIGKLAGVLYFPQIEIRTIN